MLCNCFVEKLGFRDHVAGGGGGLQSLGKPPNYY